MTEPTNDHFAPLLVRDLQKNFGDLRVLRGLSMRANRGETVAIIGPSGSGKSTLLRVLMMLEKPDGGRVEIDGQSVWTMPGDDRPATEAHLRSMRGKLGIVFQHFNLFPHMTVLRNLTEAPVRVRGLSRNDAEALARKLLAMVGLEDKADAYPAQLSGGQKQRVAITRALAMEPEIMLFDEVTSALDPELIGEVLQTLRRIATDTDVTMLIVTHQMNFARAAADRVVFIDEGVVIEEGAPKELFGHPKQERTQRFLESVLEFG
ncbi:MAG: ectoine/hydroxyectoine ABC transporter ATP-binding protein EhuA [Deltaproteobacteria bacterium]|nr:ectoine/hydroxyectoine ABC transporter ATP-binding protein EhuA [Deltaproteobacteria bacterium]MCB9479173.1 ectoine/hydroxyectoine ABC transporter ATP-binding protein EhuA [Deltaproteobacteria bacterium]